MRIVRNSLPVLAFMVSTAFLFAMGTTEVLRFPVRRSADGGLVVISTVGDKIERLSLPPSSQDGYRFSWQGSYYELVTYPSGRYAVLSLDKYLKGRSLGHTIFLKGREEPDRPIPEWVTDERSLLTGLPQFSGFLALRYSKASMASTRKLEVEQVLRETIHPFIVSTLGNPSDADRATAALLADDLAGRLAPLSRLSTYWIEILWRDPGGTKKDSDYVSSRKIYALVEIPIAASLSAIDGLKRDEESGNGLEYASAAGISMLEILSTHLQKIAGIGSTQ